MHVYMLIVLHTCQFSRRSTPLPFESSWILRASSSSIIHEWQAKYDCGTNTAYKMCGVYIVEAVPFDTYEHRKYSSTMFYMYDDLFLLCHAMQRRIGLFFANVGEISAVEDWLKLHVPLVYPTTTYCCTSKYSNYCRTRPSMGDKQCVRKSSLYVVASIYI